MYKVNGELVHETGYYNTVSFNGYGLLRLRKLDPYTEVKVLDSETGRQKGYFIVGCVLNDLRVRYARGQKIFVSNFKLL